MTTDPTDALHAELRHLRAENHRLREEIAELEGRLAYAQQQVGELRAKVVGTVNQAAAPRETPG